jgi:hypothetical protein
VAAGGRVSDQPVTPVEARERWAATRSRVAQRVLH